MKILIVNTFDIEGGAARAAYRLHKSLQNFNIDSTMLVQKKFSNDNTVIEIDNSLDNKSGFYDSLVLQDYPNKSQTLFSTSAIPNQYLIDFINKRIDSVLGEINSLKDEIGQLKGLIGTAKKRAIQDINDFLSMAGISYKFEIND